MLLVNVISTGYILLPTVLSSICFSMQFFLLKNRKIRRPFFSEGIEVFHNSSVIKEIE